MDFDKDKMFFAVAMGPNGGLATGICSSPNTEEGAKAWAEQQLKGNVKYNSIFLIKIVGCMERQPTPVVYHPVKEEVPVPEYKPIPNPAFHEFEGR